MKLWLTLAGGFCGALTRYLLGAPLLALAAALPLANSAFPYDTLAINLSGALALGALFGLVEHGAPVAPDVRLAIGTGFLGAYTTFSSFMVGTVSLVSRGHPFAALLYVAGSMVGGVVLAHAGVLLAGWGWRGWPQHARPVIRRARRWVLGAGALAGTVARRENRWWAR